MTRSNTSWQTVAFKDSPNMDAFSRLRVATPTAVFSAQFTYDLQPLVYEAITAQSWATVTHNTTNRNALMTFSSTPTGGKAYLQSYTPIRCGMTCTGTVSTTMDFNCCTVITSGWQDKPVWYEFSQEWTVTAANGARTHILSLRPKTTFNSIVNRVSIVFLEIDIIATGANPILWELCIGQAINRNRMNLCL